MESEAPGEGGCWFLLKIPGGGGFPGGEGVSRRLFKGNDRESPKKGGENVS